MEKQIKKFSAKLISIAGKPSATATGTEFRRCTIEYKAEDGSIKQASARMWEKNFAYGVEVGESYSAKATPLFNFIVCIILSCCLCLLFRF